MRKGIVTFTILSLLSFTFILHNETGSIDVLGQNNHTYASKFNHNEIPKDYKESIKNVDINISPKPSETPETAEIKDTPRVTSVVSETVTEEQAAAQTINNTNLKTSESVSDSKKRQVIFLGDSLTEGLSIYGFFPEAKIIGVNSLNTISAAEQTDNIVELNPSKLFILLGINDIWEGDSVDDFVVRYKGLISDLKQRTNGCDIYIESILPVSEAALERNPSISNLIIDSANDRIKQMCKEEKVKFIDVSSKLKDEKGNLRAEYSNDGVHLINTYYPLWTETLEKYIK